MAVQYQAPTDDMAFIIRHIVDSDTIRQLPGFEEFTDDVIEAVLEEAGKFNAGVISELNTVSDQQGTTLGADHTVTTADGFKAAYEQ